MRRSLALILLAALVLAGCTVTPKAKPQANLSGALNVLVIGNPGLESTLFSAFSNANPGVKPKSVQLGDNDDFEATIAKIKSGEIKVDAIVAPANRFLFAQGAIQPLDDLVKSEKISLKEYGNTLDLAKYNGKLMGLPVTVSPLVVTYNKDMFEKAGLKAPTTGWTWAEFEQDAAALAKLQTGKDKGWGMGMPAWVMVDLLLTAGKGPTDPDLKPLQEAIDRLARLRNADKVLAPLDLGDSQVSFFTSFTRGEMGMLVGYWENSFGHSDKPAFGWSVAPLPSTTATQVSATLAMLTTSAENKDAAKAFVTFVSGPVGAQAVTQLPGAPVPGYVDDTVKSQWLAHSTLKDDSLWMLNQKYLQTPDYPEALAEPLLREADAVLQGVKKSDEAIKSYEEARKPLMSKK